MEEKKTIFNYLAQIFTVFGITVFLLIILGKIFGEDAKAVSDIFSLGSKGIASDTMIQFLAVSAAVTLFRFIFFTDVLVKKMSLVGRTISMLILIVAVIAVMVFLFNWFPVNRWEIWALFFICFGCSFGVSVAVTFINEKMENRKMEEALRKLKKAEGALKGEKDD